MVTIEAMRWLRSADLVRAANLTVYRGMSDQEALAEVRKATEKTE